MDSNNLIYQIKKLDKNIGTYIIKHGEAPVPVPPSRTQIMIIQYIISHDNDIYQKDLEKNLQLTRATLSGVLKTMEKNGIIKRTSNENDARSKKIVLNQKLKEDIACKKNILKDVEKKLTNGINQKDLNIFINTINKKNQNINLMEDDINAKTI